MTRISSRLVRMDPLPEAEGGTKTASANSLPSGINNRDMSVPEIDLSVVSYLRTVFPNQPNRSMSPRQLDWSIGQQEVIDHLQAQWEEQQKGS